MVKTSMDYRRAVVQDRIFHVRAVMRFPDGTEIVLTNADLMSDGMTVKAGVSSTDSFDIGSASIGSVHCVWIIRMAGSMPMILRARS